MKNTAIITVVLAILAAGVVGLMMLFGFIDAERAGPILMKTVGAFLIVGICVVAIGALMPAKKDSQD
ncbi:MAG: hypothetical protein ACR2QT_00970 [Woeseiaceae bacterium]